MSGSLSPRAQTLLAAVEREAEDRRRALTGEPPAAAGAAAVADRPVRVEPALLAALEMGVAGLTRDAVAERLRADYRVSDPSALLDAVFAGATRLRRARTP